MLLQAIALHCAVTFKTGTLEQKAKCETTISHCMETPPAKPTHFANQAAREAWRLEVKNFIQGCFDDGDHSND